MGRPKNSDCIFAALDFGTGTTFIAARDHNDRVETVRDPDGNSPTMSAIGFEEGDPTKPLFGITALNYRPLGPQWVATMNKRALHGHPDIPLLTDRNGKDWTAVELSVLFVKHLLDHAAQVTGKKIKGVIYTVPAFWDSKTRELLRSIIEQAGYKPLSAFNEPTAAILGFGMEQAKPGTYLVVDCGMGTSDVTIMHVGTDCDYTGIATAGRDDMAGREMTRALIGLCVGEMKERNLSLDSQRDLREYILLENAVDAAKLQLSSQQKAFITWRAGGELFDLEVTRERYEKAIATILQGIDSLVVEVLAAAQLSPEQVDGVVPVGGASRTPAIKNLLVSRFGGKKLLESADKDTAIVKGAAAAIGLKIKEAIEAGSDHELAAIAPEYAVKCEDKLREVSGAGLGVEAVDVATGKAAFLVIIPANTPLPHESTKVCGLRDESGTGAVPIRILQGNPSRPLSEAHELEVFHLNNLPAGRSKDRIEITFKIDSSGIVSVRVRDLESGQEITGEVDASGAVAKSSV
jgi:molecular chaperone DnaK